MKRKWYRSRAAKAALIVISHISVVMIVLCAVLTSGLFRQGITFKDMGKSYVESRHFERDMYQSASTILQNLNAQVLFPSEQSIGTKVVDLGEITETYILVSDEDDDGDIYPSYPLDNITYENTSGLAYSVSDLLDWAKGSWDYNSYYEGMNILICVNADGTYTYYYYNDFEEKIKSGELKLVVNDSASPGEYSQEDDDLVTTLLEELKFGQVTDGLPQNYKIADAQGSIKYTDIRTYPRDTVKEKYPPVGASGILEVLNTNPKWNNRIDNAFTALDLAITAAAASLQSAADLSIYKEGNTNLSYLYIDKDNQKVLTNISKYMNYEAYETSLNDLTSDGTYFVIYPLLSDCKTNFESFNFKNAAETERDSNFQSWHHLGETSTIANDFIFAVKINTDFPIADYITDAQYNYERYAKWLLPVMTAGAVSILLLFTAFVWLTRAAGHRPGDEEIHLNAADRLCPESLLVLLLLWGIGISLFAGRFRLYTTIRVYIFAAVTAFCTTAVFLIIYLSLVRRGKAKVLWKNSLVRIMAGRLKNWSAHFPAWMPAKLKSIKGALKRFGEMLSRNTGSKVKITLLLGVFLLLQFFIMILMFKISRMFFYVLLAVDAAFLIYALRKADGREKLLDGLKRISSGELQYKIPLETLSGEQKMMADYINNIGSGLDAAVENSLKNERMKTELITNVSHDIKTPLTSIINYVGLLKRENFTDEKICGYLDILEEKAQRLKILTEDVVEASKASTGNITLDMRDLDFVEMLHQVIGEFEEKFRERSLTMMVHFTDEPSIICADGQRMWRVLENIFNNIVKYAMEGTRVYAEVNKADQNIIFSLKNISAQPLNISADELTERFIRGDVARNTEGSGLGLSIAKSLTELQGGEFKLYVDGDLFKVTITFTAK